MTDIGQHNIDFVKAYLSTEGLSIAAEDVGNRYPRKINYYPATGKVRVKKLSALYSPDIALREQELIAEETELLHDYLNIATLYESIGDVVDYFRRRLHYTRLLWLARVYRRLSLRLHDLVVQLEGARAALSAADRTLASQEHDVMERRGFSASRQGIFLPSASGQKLRPSMPFGTGTPAASRSVGAMSILATICCIFDPARNRCG